MFSNTLDRLLPPWCAVMANPWLRNVLIAVGLLVSIWRLTTSPFLKATGVEVSFVSAHDAEPLEIRQIVPSSLDGKTLFLVSSERNGGDNKWLITRGPAPAWIHEAQNFNYYDTLQVELAPLFHHEKMVQDTTPVIRFANPDCVQLDLRNGRFPILLECSGNPDEQNTNWVWWDGSASAAYDGGCFRRLDGDQIDPEAEIVSNTATGKETWNSLEYPSGGAAIRALDYSKRDERRVPLREDFKFWNAIGAERLLAGADPNPPADAAIATLYAPGEGRGGSPISPAHHISLDENSGFKVTSTAIPRGGVRATSKDRPLDSPSPQTSEVSEEKSQGEQGTKVPPPTSKDWPNPAAGKEEEELTKATGPLWSLDAAQTRLAISDSEHLWLMKGIPKAGSNFGQGEELLTKKGEPWKTVHSLMLIDLIHNGRNDGIADYLAAANKKTLSVWRLPTPEGSKLEQRFELSYKDSKKISYSEEITCLATSTDGRYLAVGIEDTVRLEKDKSTKVGRVFIYDLSLWMHHPRAGRWTRLPQAREGIFQLALGTDLDGVASLAFAPPTEAARRAASSRSTMQTVQPSYYLYVGGRNGKLMAYELHH